MIIKDLEIHKDLTSDELSEVRGGKDLEADDKSANFEVQELYSTYTYSLTSAFIEGFNRGRSGTV